MWPPNVRHGSRLDHAYDMDLSPGLDENTTRPFKRLFERLREELPGYEFDENFPPFHSSYDNWHFLGWRRKSKDAVSNQRASSHSASDSRPSSTHTRSEHDTFNTDEEKEKEYRVVARVSRHVLRLEREFKLCQSLWRSTSSASDQKHFVRPLDFYRLPPRLPEDVTLCASLVEAPGRNYLREVVELGPNFYTGAPGSPQLQKHQQVALLTFLDFAIGATESCEILHLGNNLVHGEIRGDAFHYNKETGIVRMINFGSGARSFEHGLTSANWSTLTSQRGVEHKLQFIAPEQTGRLPAEPDARTDIYSLGILFWSMLTGQAPFDGKSPLDIMQSLLSRRIPLVSSIRSDVPVALSSVIQKMTQRNMEDRYNSSSGVKHDLQELRRILTDGDQEALENFKLATTDVSCLFNLPSHLVGRETQRNTIVDILENVARRSVRAAASARNRLHSVNSNATTSSGDRLDWSALEETVSDTTASEDRERDRESRLDSIPELGHHEPFQRRNKVSLDTQSLDKHERRESIASSSTSVNEDPEAKILRSNKSSDESRGSVVYAESLQRTTSSYQSEPSVMLRHVQKLEGHGKTELIAICGATGYGKSSLVQSIQASARRHGYFTSAKFDQVQSLPFAPMVRVVSSLFRQIFSENDVSTPFHENIRAFVKPIWRVLHTYLQLPIWLLAPTINGKAIPNGHAIQNDSTGVMPERKMCNAASTQEWLRSGGSNKNPRFMHIIVDLFRLLAVQRFVCFCLDDLQFADQESLELLQVLVKSHIPLVIMVTYRSEDLLTSATRRILQQAVKVQLNAFTEDDTAQYVSDTLHRSKEYCTPLVAVVQEKTGGNPFFVREMLDSAHRRHCIYYCWKCSAWEFDLDKLFNEFSSPDVEKYSSNDFILRRMRQFPTEVQTLLAWASIVGNSFSFTLIKRLMSCSCSRLVPQPLIPPPSLDPVAGLQAALASYIIMPTEDEDRFKFSHDRYVAAAESLCEAYRKEEMHFVVACSIIKHEPYNPVNHPNTVLFEQARHVCDGLEVVKARIQNRSSFRDLLYQAAETARETGVQGSGIQYFKRCLELLPEDPWSNTGDDGSYSETLTLVTKAAEAFLFVGYPDRAAALLGEIFEHARSPSDSTPAAIIRGRMYAQQGNGKMALISLKSALSDLDIKIENLTWEQCDDEFQRIVPMLQATPPSFEDVENNARAKTMASIGALLGELQAACYWSDALLFYQATLATLNVYLERGMFPQVGLAYVCLAAISIWRFSLIQAATEFGNVALNIFDFYGEESFVTGRGLTLYAIFLGHIVMDVRSNFVALNKGLEAASITGDKVVHLITIGISATYRLCASENLADIETFIKSIGEEFPTWAEDIRGGAFIMGVRQYARALAGRTYLKSPHTVLSDEEHSSEEYVELISSTASNPRKPLSIYYACKLMAMYRFGHYREALAFGDTVLNDINELLCTQFNYSTYFYLSMAIIACVRDNAADSDDPDRRRQLERVAEYRARIELVASLNSVTYTTYLKLLDAEVEDIHGRYDKVLAYYEAAINHAVLHGMTLEEALSLELYADWLVRRGSSRPARGILLEAIAANRRVGAFGKANHISEKYGFLLYGTRSLSAVDAGTQTVDTDVGNSYAYRLERMTTHEGPQLSAERTKTWFEPQSATGASNQDPSAPLAVGLAATGLDIIDLASILESSQLLSSELNVNRLLSKLSRIILDSTGAEFAGLVLENESSEWYLGSVAAPEGIETPAQGTLLNDVDDQVATQVTLYVLRFREQVFLPNVIEDERFANVPDSWLERNPGGASVIAIPILHGDQVLLGSLYCQAPPNTFTERTVTLLKLLINQIAISIANALLFERSEKVQASNTSMLEVQKQALAQAREAEKKAKAAEAKAMEMVRLKDEAARAKSMFLANVSHELRTPLYGVIGMSEMLKSTQLSKEQEEHADSIRLCADTLLSVINDILDFSKLEAGKMRVFSVPLSLTETISEVVRALSYTNIERNLETIRELDLDPDLVVMGDPVRLHQILMNLMSNAYKFTSKGSVTVRAKVDYEDAENIEVTVSVTDTGIGISEEQQKKLFLPFSQADASTARSYGGTGLGLSICKAILENVMHGKIWLTSKPGVGTTVSFRLPFKKANQSKLGDQNGTALHNNREADPMAIFTPPAEDDAPGARAALSLQGIPRDQLRVCIAEDNAINQKIAINFVKKLGFHCEAFGDGQQALDALALASAADHPFHLVLMDVQMPVLDGYNATREIRKHADPRVRDILIIAMTASAIRGDREKCLEAGMNNYLAKPVRADTLKQMLESYLHQPAKTMPNLQQEANQLVNTVVSEADGRARGDGGEADTPTNETNPEADEADDARFADAISPRTTVAPTFPPRSSSSSSSVTTTVPGPTGAGAGLDNDNNNNNNPFAQQTRRAHEKLHAHAQMQAQIHAAEDQLQELKQKPSSAAGTSIVLPNANGSPSQRGA